jgi:hypothetical protein
MPTRGAHERIDLRLRLPFEVAVNQRLHRGEIERRSQPADHGPEDDDRGEALAEDHRECPHRVEDEADHVRPLATEEVAELAADPLTVVSRSRTTAEMLAPSAGSPLAAALTKES